MNPLYLRAAALCAASEHCPSDVRDKLIRWGLGETEADALVAQLISENYLNEERYAHAFVHDKFMFQHWGRAKIRFALRAKAIPDALIDAAMDECIDTDAYVDDCVQIVQRKMQGMSLPLSQADRARLYRFAAQRGFEPSVISQAIARCSD